VLKVDPNKSNDTHFFQYLKRFW